jgi:hypothetical protein
LANTDLVVGFERVHVVTAVVDGGAAREHTFTLPELVVLLGAAEPVESGGLLERAQERIRRAAAARPRDGAAVVPVPELEDPLGRAPAAQAEIAQRVGDLTLELRERLFA